MTSFIIDDILDGLSRWGRVVRVVVIKTLGSTPRDMGAAMVVGGDDFSGTIGGGKLEYMALEEARNMLQISGEPARKPMNFILGPHLRQCCGGVAWLLFERFEKEQVSALKEFKQGLTPQSLIIRQTGREGFYQTEQDVALGNFASVPVLYKDEEKGEEWFIEPALQKRTPLYIYGAGHVGRALVRVMEDLPFEIFWVDTAEGRFPSDIRSDVNCIIAPKQDGFVAHQAEKGAFHVAMTYSHDSDLNIARAVLTQAQPAYLGVIGSESKKAKFLNRLKKEGMSDEDLSLFTCPVGAIVFEHKDPAMIAISIAAQLIVEWERLEAEQN